MRLLTLTGPFLASALLFLVLTVFSGTSPDVLEASECVRNNENLCKSNEACVKYDLIIWEYNQCTTTHQYGTLTDCKYCHY